MTLILNDDYVIPLWEYQSTSQGIHENTSVPPAAKQLSNRYTREIHGSLLLYMTLLDSIMTNNLCLLEK